MSQIPSFTPIDLKTSFRQFFLETCQKGYFILGRTPPLTSDNYNPWQYSSGHPPSYFGQGRYRFLKTLQTAQNFQPKAILEVAAGGGFNAACLYETGRRVVINDLRLAENEVKTWLTGQHLETAIGNLFDLNPETLGKFDLVIACEVIEHVAHGDKLVNHLKQFLIPGGYLILTTPNGSYLRSKLPSYSQITDFNALESEQFKPDADGHLYLYTPAEIHHLLKQAEFQKIEIDLSITPWLSGHAGLRFLPKSAFLTAVYYWLDNVTKSLGIQVRKKLCTQMIISAKID